MSSRRCRIGALAGLLLASTLLSAAPVAADSEQRQRSGTSLWAPQWNDGRVSYFSSDENRIRWRFQWWDANHMRQLWGAHRGFEVKAKTTDSYASEYMPYKWSSLPAGARAYRDTMAMDNDCCTFGYGVANANYLTTTQYTAITGVYKPYVYCCYTNINWSVNATTLEDHHLLGCGTSPEFCNFGDYTQWSLPYNSFSVTQTDTRTSASWQNSLLNQSFEDGTANYSINNTNGHFVYCGGFGWQSNCALQFNNAGSGSWVSVSQDVVGYTNPGYEGNAEVMVRCPSGGPTCSGAVAVWGLGGYQNESRVAYFSLSAGSGWHLCRLDEEHGWGSGFSYSHDKLRFEVYNNSGNNLDLDYTTLAKWTDRIDGTASERLDPPPVGGVCTNPAAY